LYSIPKFSATVEEILNCYNVAEEDQENEDPKNLQIPETEGEHAVERPELESMIYANPLITRKVNIGTKDMPKFFNIGDY
jgi:hypothetical protein